MDAVPTFAWIGWDDAGTIDRVGPEAIVTSFWCVVVPVRAGNSFYRFRTRDYATTPRVRDAMGVPIRYVSAVHQRDTTPMPRPYRPPSAVG